MRRTETRQLEVEALASVADSTTGVALSSVQTAGWGRIAGIVQMDAAAVVHVCQGLLSGEDGDALDEWAGSDKFTPSEDDSPEGSGSGVYTAAFSVALAADKVGILIENATGGLATVNHLEARFVGVT